jgi:transcriptional regulator with XRE-family HTH domain
VHQVSRAVNPAPLRCVVAPSLRHAHGAVVRPSREERAQRAAEIGARIAQARIGSGWTNVTRFAAKIGTDRNSVGRWERGEVLPDALSIEAVSRVTRRSADWILRGEASPEWAETIEAWRKGATGSRAPDAAVGFIRSLPLAGYIPSLRFLDLVFLAYEHGLTPDQALTMAGENITAESIR